MMSATRRKMSWPWKTTAIGIGLCGFLIFLQGTSLVGKEKELEPFALLVGTCTNDEGFSLPGATIRVEMQSNEEKKGKMKKWQTLSDARGEFALRLPPGRHTFLVYGSRAGFASSQGTVSFVQDERQNIILKFELESSKK
jgi:hypothetical protein